MDILDPSRKVNKKSRNSRITCYRNVKYVSATLNQSKTSIFCVSGNSPKKIVIFDIRVLLLLIRLLQ